MVAGSVGSFADALRDAARSGEEVGQRLVKFVDIIEIFMLPDALKIFFINDIPAHMFSKLIQD